MAGELCGKACGHCGRCDAEPEHFCDWCGQVGCPGDCPSYYDAMDEAELDARADNYFERELDDAA